MHVAAGSTLTSQSVEAKVIRRNGTVEDLGTIAYWHRSPVRRAAWFLGQFLRGRRPGRVTTRR
jgi:hypothetical protein